MRSAEEMRNLFTRLEIPGLSMKASGQRAGITYTTLQYWRRKLREDGAEKRLVTGAKPSAALSPVHVIPDAKPVDSKSKGFEVWLANGVSLEVPAGFDEGELQRLVGILSAC